MAMNQTSFLFFFFLVPFGGSLLALCRGMGAAVAVEQR